MEDIKVLALCKKNPNEGLEHIIDQYTPLIHSIVARKIETVGTLEDVKECVSDVFVDFYQQLDEINLEKGSIKAYLAMIANHKAIDQYRKMIKKLKKTVSNEDLLEFEDIHTNTEQSVLDKEERALLLQAIDGLGEPDKEIFIRKYYLRQQTKEIANILQLKDNTVDKKVSRGLKKLKILLGG
ncbi:RNA polymerase sigma-70 factor (ECF subfamily) [Natranaerovirga hydrolytica]|uniref:RNA polymerase sigma-70 factor (ECF subfamily) n=1 Tax=Natranaerovirga hydrolytica TaxID=680378 RepID=A0A4R1MPI3_9FIRM|nr:sigma-70 family RNA polymerase sigma factor [Natranaerovirga hydrolytica]TCK93214.1 RNA polymerase sigma-70 factor (ECF subfamily) [Natranaerovirga hydrolytica]